MNPTNVKWHEDKFTISANLGGIVVEKGHVPSYDDGVEMSQRISKAGGRDVQLKQYMSYTTATGERRGTWATVFGILAPSEVA